MISHFTSIYIRNRSGLKIDPWGTPALTSAHEENWPFKSTLCLLFFRKSFIELRSLTEIPFCFNLKIKSLCQTLSKAMEISTNTSNFVAHIKRLVYFVSNLYKLVNAGVCKFEAWLISGNYYVLNKKRKRFFKNKSFKNFSKNWQKQNRPMISRNLFLHFFKDWNKITPFAF